MISKGYDIVVKWNYVCCVRGQLVNLPCNGIPIVFIEDGTYFAGYYINSDGFDYGFYSNVVDSGEDNFHEACNVSKWMEIKE